MRPCRPFQGVRFYPRYDREPLETFVQMSRGLLFKDHAGCYV